MTPLYPDGVYAPLPRFSKNTQTNIAPSVTRNTASARCSRDTPIISVAWSSKGSLLFPCFGQPSPRYSPRHAHSGSSHRFYALRRRSDISGDGDRADNAGFRPLAAPHDPSFWRRSMPCLTDTTPVHAARQPPQPGAGRTSTCLSPIFIPEQHRPRRPALLTLLFLYTAASYR